MNSEAEATSLSTLLEASIRMGLVIGTRAFNKKFYIALKRFVAENAASVLKLIEKKSVPLPEIAKSLNIDEDAARTILYLLAESGDATEVRKGSSKRHDQTTANLSSSITTTAKISITAIIIFGFKTGPFVGAS